MQKTAVIVPVHNGLDYTKKCLQWLSQSIQQANLIDDRIEIIVVDDGSTDGTELWINQHFPQVIVLKGDGHLWWSGAVNVGAMYALNYLNSDYILLWNNDIKLDLDYFSQLYNILRRVNDNTIIGSKIYFLNQPEVISLMGCLFNPRSGRHTFIASNQIDSNKYNQITKADWTAGMGTIIPKKVFQKIGFWDEKNFPQYHGDSDFNLRAKKNGFELLIHPNLKIWNDSDHTGMLHKNNLFMLVQSLFSIRSNFNICKQFKFIHRHAESILAYRALLRIYAGYIGGFAKSKILNLFQKQQTSYSQSCHKT